jgi:hypothetical protein
MMLDDPTQRLLILAVRNAERALLRARSEYEISAAKHAHQQALDQLERHRMGDGT